MLNVRLAGDHLFGKLLFTWLSLVVSMVISFCAVLYPTRCLGWDLELNLVSFWGFSFLLLKMRLFYHVLVFVTFVQNKWLATTCQNAILINFEEYYNTVCIDHLYSNAISAVQMNASTGKRLRTSVGVRQDPLQLFSRKDHVWCSGKTWCKGLHKRQNYY